MRMDQGSISDTIFEEIFIINYSPFEQLTYFQSDEQMSEVLIC